MPVKLFTGVELYKNSSDTFDAVNGYKVCFTGIDTAISAKQASNPEWIFNQATTEEPRRRGPITSLNKYDNGQSIKDISLPDKAAGNKYVASGSNTSKVLRKTDNKREYWWNGSKQKGEETDLGWRSENSNGTVYLYTAGEKVIDYEPEKFANVDNSPDYVVAKQFNAKTGEGLVTLVYKHPTTNRYIYKWNNKLIAETSTLEKGWIERERYGCSVSRCVRR